MHIDDHRFMAINTIVFRYLSIKRLNLNGVGEAPGCKSPTMVKTIDAFHNPLLGESMWGMAVITDGYSLVAAAIPAIELFAHDMAVDTGIGVIRQIGSALRIAEGKQAQPNQDTQHCNDAYRVKVTFLVQGKPPIILLYRQKVVTPNGRVIFHL